MKSADELTERQHLPIQEKTNQVGATRSDGKWFWMLNYYTNRLPVIFSRLSTTERVKVERARPKRRAHP